MDEFIRDRTGSLPTFGAPWSDADRRRLQEIAAAKAEDYVARGVTGHPLLWERERVELLADLDAMLSDDNAWRRERDSEVVASELMFGMRGFAPVAVEVPRGRVLMGRQRGQDRQVQGRCPVGHRHQDRRRIKVQGPQR